MEKITLTTTKVAKLKQDIQDKTQEWRDLKDTMLYPQRREAGNYLRKLQNEGYSVTELCELWGTRDRKTVYDLLKLATIEKTRAYPKRRTQSGPNRAPLVQELAPSPWETHVKRDGNTIETVTPIPPDAWPAELDPRYRPSLPWVGKAMWDENGVLVESESNTKDNTNPLHRLMKLGVISL